MRRVLLGVALCVLAPAVRGEDTAKLTARSELRRRYLWIGADGTVSSVASGDALKVRVTRGEARALEETAVCGPNGALHLEIRSKGRLLPDDYGLEVLRGDEVVARTTLHVGKPEEAGPARESLAAWLKGARGTLRDLSALLERRAAFHRARLLDEAHASGGPPGRLLVDAQSGAWQQALDRFELRYRTARMDFAVYEKEILLSPFPEAKKALSDVFAALLVRRDELKTSVEEALAGRDKNPGAAPAVLEGARASAKALGLDADDSDTWGAGPLAVPEPGHVENGRFASALGVTVEVPGGFTEVERRLKSEDNPEDRVLLAHTRGARVALHVRELPDGIPGSDLGHAVEMLAWEEWGNSAFKRETGKGDASSYTVTGSVVFAGAPGRLLLVDRVADGGKRIFELRVTCPVDAWGELGPELEKVAARFAAEGK
jgi:hypothetical protein